MSSADDGLLVDAAARIGARLVASAVYDGESCTWPVTTPGSQPRTAVQGIAGGMLYQGTAGIALFLGELWGIVGDRRLLACARAALLHADRQRAHRRVTRIGLHTGDVGVAVATARLQVLTGDAEWGELLERQLAGLEAHVEADRVFDVIGGVAGAVLGLLQIHAGTGHAGARALALRCGAHLERGARRRSSGWSWPANMSARQDLCGYAHGASGAAHAFLELFALTGESRWRFAATRAMEYERHQAAGVLGDWPDLRCAELSELLLRPGGHASLRATLRRGGAPPQWKGGTMRAWCHGAPGIALTRMRAVSLDVDAAACRREMEAALRVTRRELVRPERLNASLCHGLFGNAESLLLADEHLALEHRSHVTEIVAAALHDAERPGGRWLTGAVNGGPDPSLMLGEAGMGHFLLRLARPDVPSVLCLSSWAPAPAVARSGPAGIATDAELRTAETGRLLRRLFTAARHLPGAEPVRERIDAACAAAPTVEVAIDSVAALVAATDPAPVAERLRDAMQVDLAWISAERAFDDYLAQMYLELRRPTPTAMPWDDTGFAEEVQFVVTPGARFVRSRWAWDEWPVREQPEPDAAERVFLLYRTGRAVSLRPLSPPTAQVLEVLARPRTIAEATNLLLERLDGDAATAAELPRFVRETVRAAFSHGLLETIDTVQAR